MDHPATAGFRQDKMHRCIMKINPDTVPSRYHPQLPPSRALCIEWTRLVRHETDILLLSSGQGFNGSLAASCLTRGDGVQQQLSPPEYLDDVQCTAWLCNEL